ncbi:MAG: cytochrome c biogenesis protein CcdA [Bilophila wadsworthia]
MDTEYAELDGHPAAVLWVTPQKGYHTYSHYADAPIPTSLNVRNVQGHPTAATVLYPQGRLTPDTFEPAKQILAYTARFPIFIRFDAPVSGPLSADLSMLLCSDKNCVPVQQTFSLALPETLPPPSPAALEAYGQLGKAETPPPLPNPFLASPPQQSVTQLTPLSGPSVQLAGSPAEPDEWRFTPRFPQESLEPTALGTALFLGLLAGLILNVMPCVLPVLTMKVSALLSSSVMRPKVSASHFREHNVLFAAGILTWFLVLAFCVGALGLAWGGLFQNTHLVYGLLILVFLLSLSLFDVFTLPVLDFKVGASRNPKTQAYLTGLVATLLATPCSGPLLGGVLGWAALQPLPVIVAVFTATGIGMALPYLVLAAWPGAAASSQARRMDRDHGTAGRLLSHGHRHLPTVHSPRVAAARRARHPARLRAGGVDVGAMGRLAGLGASKALYGRARAPYGMRLHLVERAARPRTRAVGNVPGGHVPFAAEKRTADGRIHGGLVPVLQIP